MHLSESFYNNVILCSISIIHVTFHGPDSGGFESEQTCDLQQVKVARVKSWC